MRHSSSSFIYDNGSNLLRIVGSWPEREDTFTLTYDDLTSFNYSADGTSPNAIQFGYASICTVDFSIFNATGEWDNVPFAGAKLNVFVGKRLASGDEYVKLGVFTVDKSPKKGSIISITASDNMALLDEKFKGISFPCTLQDVVQRVCNQVGINLATTNFTNFSRAVDSLESLTSKTCREVLSFCCELAGSFAIINSDGDLEVRWFDTSNVDLEIDNTMIGEFSPDDTPTPRGLSASFAGEEVVFGDVSALMHLSDDNPLVDNLSVAQANDLVGHVFNGSVASLAYNVGTVSAPGLAVLEPGDVVSLVHKGQRYVLLVGSFKLSGNLKMTITSPSLGTSSKPYSSGSSGSSSGSSESSLKSTYIISYDNAAAPKDGPGVEPSVELVALPITKLGNHVPVALFTTTFKCQDAESQSFAKFDMVVGSRIVHTAYYKCFDGENTFSFSWPLVDIPDGQTRVRVLVESITINGTPPPFLTWEKEKTSLFIMGRGFNTSVNQWNGMLLASDTVPSFRVTNFHGGLIGYTAPHVQHDAWQISPLHHTPSEAIGAFVVESYKQDTTFKGVASIDITTT